MEFTRITIDPAKMSGKPCIRHMRVTVGMILQELAAGSTTTEILQLYPYLEEEDIQQSLGYAAWRLQEQELPMILGRS